MTKRERFFLIFFLFGARSYEDISMDSNQNQNSNPLDFSQSGIAYKDVIVQPGLVNQVRFRLQHIDFISPRSKHELNTKHALG